MITHVGEERVPGGYPCPHPKGRGTSVPRIFGASYVHAHRMRNSNQICCCNSCIPN